MSPRALAVLLLATPIPAAADQVFLHGGGRITGVVVERTGATVVVEVGAGRVTLPAARVERIVAGLSPLAVYRERASDLAESDVLGWLALALWARDHDLHTQARECFEHVLFLDPRSATAQRALGNVPLGERWVTPEESYRARGYVFFEGEWVTPAERDGAIQERTARVEAERARVEAEARVREAEARARVAEAEARRAEAAAGGIPFTYAAGGFWPGPRFLHPVFVQPTPTPALAPEPPPRAPRTGSLGPRRSARH